MIKLKQVEVKRNYVTADQNNIGAPKMESQKCKPRFSIKVNPSFRVDLKNLYWVLRY